jgi:N-acetylmuramoyl-L-alanine amidase
VSRPANRQRILLGTAAALTVALALALYQPAPAAAPPEPVAAAAPSDTPISSTPTQRAAGGRATDTPAPAATFAAPTATLPAPPTATALPTAIPLTPTPSQVPTPTPRPAGTVPRIGVQAGHWKTNELPDELARLRSSSGAFAGGHHEADVNLAVARRVVALLQSRGLAADLLPATIPPSYDADAFVAIHADGSASTSSRGFKAATPWRTSRASQQLLEALTAEYASATGLPAGDGITFDMRGYYAFNNRRHAHAIARTTPAVILEMGFLTNSTDRAVIVDQADNVAIGIANGIIRYLNHRDPLDGAALIPPDFRIQRPIDPAGLDILAAPRDGARVIGHIEPNSRIFVIQERDGWYQGVARGSRDIGWFRTEQVTDTNDPLPTPPPDSNG